MKKLVLVCMLLGLSACPGPNPIPVVGGSVINCLGENRTQVDLLITEIKNLFVGGKPQWSLVYERAKKAGKDVGGCVISELVQYYLGGFAGPMDNGDAWAAHEALEKFRAEEAGGASFQTKCVRADGTTEVCKL